MTALIAILTTVFAIATLFEEDSKDKRTFAVSTIFGIASLTIIIFMR